MEPVVAYQYDPAGLYVCATVADESPLEPGVLLLPARTTLIEPPAAVSDDQWPRWDGSRWVLVNKPVLAQPDCGDDPVAKLTAFLAANPDVAALLG